MFVYRTVIATIVILAHAVGLEAIAGPPVNLSSPKQESEALTATIEMLQDNPQTGLAPLPEIHLVKPAIELDEPTMIKLEDTEDVADVIAPASSPRLLRMQSVSLETIVKEAGISVRHPFTIVLSVRVSEEGFASDVKVARSCGDNEIDSAAVRYALELHWVPGTQNQQPKSMWINFPVIVSSVSVRSGPR